MSGSAAAVAHIIGAANRPGGILGEDKTDTSMQATEPEGRHGSSRCTKVVTTCPRPASHILVFASAALHLASFASWIVFLDRRKLLMDSVRSAANHSLLRRGGGNVGKWQDEMSSQQ